MIHASSPLPAEADIVIIGSGAAGISLALALDGAEQRVLLLEAGGETSDQSFYRATRVAPDSHVPAELFRRRAFGGTTSLWGGRCIPLDPIDFERRDWVPGSGWPIAFEDLDRFTPRAMEICEAGAPAFLGEQIFPGASLLAERMNHSDIEANAVERFSPPTHFGARYRERLASSANIGVLTETPVLRIMAEDGTVTGVETPRGTIRARQVIVAAGGLETPRLLLASGLGNDLVGRFYQTHTTAEFGAISFTGKHRIAYERAKDGAWCRRYLRLSPGGERRSRSVRLFVRPNNPPVGDPSHGNAILSAIHFAKAGLIAEYARILTGARHVGASTGRKTVRTTLAHLRNIVLGAPALAGFLFRWLRLRTLAKRKLPSAFLENRRGVYPLFVQAEQVPNPESRITLSDEKDALGMPRIVVDWRLHDQDRELFMRGMNALRDATHGSGGEISFDPEELATVDLVPLPGHHIGTARMASAPDQGVCDPDCQVFGVKGLYIAGSAAFPTSGGANPTLAIVALSLRLGDHLLRYRPDPGYGDGPLADIDPA